jgi:hypothetical protein
MKRRVFAAALFGATMLLAGCVSDNPPAPIPAPMAESIPRPPVSARPLIWQPGHWDWTGSAYVWIPGQYVAAESHGNHWMTGYWEKAGAGWVWQPAHWI